MSSRTVETAVLCADGSIHFGPEYLAHDDPERVRAAADAHAHCSWCRGGPHVIAQRERIVTDWSSVEGGNG